MVTVINLDTGEEQIYTCTPYEAVIGAFAREHRDANSWDYKDRYRSMVILGSVTVSCGQWCAMTTMQARNNDGAQTDL